MGDTYTHANIAEKVIAELQPLRPDEDFVFFRLGNWLTDMSQFNDPPAFENAKITIWNKALAGEKILNFGFIPQMVVHLNGYLDELFGTPDPATPGNKSRLAHWCRDLVHVIGLAKFRKQGIEPAEFEDIYKSFFSQYFPHEHVDFPPWPLNEALGDRTPSSVPVHHCDGKTGGGNRKTFQYLEKQLEWIAEVLTVVENDWAIKRPNEQALKRDRHRVLARYGHASHAVEDFFFHSNFVDIAWAKLHESEIASLPVRHHRLLYRRLREPNGSGSRLSDKDSSRCNHVYTGSFGSNDVFHTLMDGLATGFEHAERDRDVPKLLLLVALKSLLMPPNEEEGARRLKRHRERLESGEYVRDAQGFVDARILDPDSGKRIERMCKHDLDLGRSFPKLTLDLKTPDGRTEKLPLGLAGMLQKIAMMAKQQVKESETRSTEIDADPAHSIEDGRTLNGASAENIGSHTLMAKDSEHKQPLRAEAVKLATRVAVHIASMMGASMNNQIAAARSSSIGSVNTFESRRLDWLHLLQHFICHPDECEGKSGDPWWVKAMTEDAADTGYVPKLISETKVSRRKQDEATLRANLEKSYNQLADQLERQWKNLVSTEVPGF